MLLYLSAPIANLKNLNLWKSYVKTTTLMVRILEPCRYLTVMAVINTVLSLKESKKYRLLG